MLLKYPHLSGLTWLPLAAAWGCSVASAADTGVGASESQLAAPLPAVDPPRHRKPPQVAFDACKGSTEGARCTVTFHARTLEGTCRKAWDEDSALACVPAQPPGPPPGER